MAETSPIAVGEGEAEQEEAAVDAAVPARSTGRGMLSGQYQPFRDT
jgi:hypothetical protein